MSTTIKLRRSAVPGRIPTIGQLDLGELAINTADGKIYFKKYDPVANTESIIDVSANLDANAILELLRGVDGANSGLDADLLDGQSGDYYLDYNNFTNVPPATLDLTLSGKVTGTAFSNTGIMTLITELANTGVTPGTYGSASLVPVITIDEDGRITEANTVSVAGVSDTYWTIANNTFTIETADGGIYNTVIEEFNDITANNIIVNGLVDGRDIAADGAKLDTLEDGLELTLTGKVTGFASSNTGVMTLVTELANTGVTPGTYGSSTTVPVITIDEDGRITVANTSPVSGIEDFSYSDANNTITLETGDGSLFNIQTKTKVELTGKVTGTATSSSGTVSIAAELANTGVTPGTYGSPTSIPVLTIDEDGRITVANTSPVSGVEDFYFVDANNTITLETGDGTIYLAHIDKLDRIEEDLTVTLQGKVTGTVTSNTGIMTVQTELANTGVTPGTYGSSTAIPIFVVDEDGRITSANTASVAGIEDFSYTAANNTITLETGDGSIFNINTETEVTLSGKVTGTATATNGNLSITTELANTGVTPGTYGSPTSIPVLTIDEDGRITVANTSPVSGVEDFYWTSSNNSLILQTGDGTEYVVPIEEFNAITANTVNGRNITVDGNKLDGIEAGATADQTAADIRALGFFDTTNDGVNSGLDADLLDGQHASDIIATAVGEAGASVGNGKIDIISGGGLSGSGTFRLNDFSNTAITISHADTSSVANTSNTNGNVINNITFDTFGHAQTVSSTNLDGRYYTETELNAGQLNNLYYTETELNNGQLDTRYYTETELNAGQLNNLYYTETELNNGQLDTRYYTETELNNGQLDNRYYTETEADNRFVNVTGDTMSGSLTVNADIIQKESKFISETQTTATTSQTAIYAFAHATFSAAEVLITATETGKRHITKLLITHNGSVAIATEYGVVYTNAELADYDVSIIGPVLQILATPSSANSTTFKIVATLIDA